MEKILSVKIVTADYYNTFPIPNLDVTYSKFREKEVKSCPIIRIFGVTKKKKKICCNIHNVFPYIFCPCPETDQKRIDAMMKEMAIQIDQKLNSSFGQTNSSQQHVYNISLCKGIPYYGFHSNDHQFFRIELYNPYLVKRTAGLLQSGAILGKMFQPHESHVPYILRFFIDFNLVGMSYLHVPFKKVNTRSLMGDPRHKKRAVSHVEVDFDGIYILNRNELLEQTNTQKASNIGIASIWEDERRRRQKNSQELPELKAAEEEIRVCEPTSSDLFFQRALKERYMVGTSKKIDEQNNTTLSDSTTSFSDNTIKKRFDMRNFLDASTYATEFSQSSASSKEEMDTTLTMDISQTIEELESHFLQTQSSDGSTTKEDQDVPNIAENDDDGDFDSLLAPFSQAQEDAKDTQSTENLNESQMKQFFEDIDNEEENEFNMTLADLEAAIFEDSDEISAEIIPQLDGVDDKINYSDPKPGPSKPPEGLFDFQVNLQALADHFNQNSNDAVNQEESLMDETIDFCENDSDDERMQSFYDQTLITNDFDDDVETSCSSDISIKKEPIDESIQDSDDDKSCIISLANEPPDPEIVLETLRDYNIPQTVNKSAFYSNPLDVTEKKEVGYNILEIKSDKLNDCNDFKSLLFEKSQLNLYQNQRLQHELGFLPKTTTTMNDFIDNNSDVIIHPISMPPTYNDAKKWIQSTTGQNDEQKPNVLEDSPVKVKRGKTVNVLNVENSQDIIENSQDYLDNTLIPQTPEMVAEMPASTIQSSIEKIEDSPTLNEFVEEGLYLSYSARRKRRRKAKNSFSKRFQEIMKAKVEASSGNLDRSMSESSQSSIYENDKLSETSEDILKDSQTTSGSSNKLSDETLGPSIIQDANIPFNDSYDISTLSETYGFKMKLESLQSTDEHTDLTILSMELHVQTKGDFNPNPETDEISAIFYCVDGFYVNEQPTSGSGIIIVCDENENLGYFNDNVEIIRVKNEMELLEEFFKKIRLYDPDIFAGYELELLSYGYLFDRGYVLSMDLCNALSRMPLEKDQKTKIIREEDENDPGDYYSEQKIAGRILLDVWRLMRHEIALTSYTFENISYHILHRRYPKHSFSFLTSMWQRPLRKWIVLEYYMTRAKTLLEILNQLDLIGRTCELAKLFGIQFFEVLSRGSQFRVESMMLRIAKRRNYVAVSPSNQQRTHMRAPEYIPLILEPESRFYTDPVIVLDFQSLYPSIIIAYNYCFSTCLGRVEHLLRASYQPFEFGAYQLRVSPSRLQFLLENDLITVSPCGVAFVKSSIREGVLPRMLKEILDTRLMVKQSMKLYKNDTALQRVLHSRQLGLKLIANVTYGYTAANFSGRMPAIEVGDSVVSKGRETLERAINLVESNEKWGCKVCYGDTDSMFVLVPGRTKEEAFKIGEEIAEVVTKENPNPVKLKLEKVYQPCILQTKKRYVGNMYETPDQAEPIFEAKGIETIRRDGCPAASKILEKSLKILFDTHDVSKVKEYVCRQFTKILEGKISIQDLIIAKEFRGIKGYKERAVVPALTMTRKWKQVDPRNEPRRGERVPFILTNGPPNSTLIRLVKFPLEVLNDESLKINSLYYITKSVIPPLNRCFLLIGVNVNDWFAELPKKQQALPVANSHVIKKSTISQFFNSTSCVICDKNCENNICEDCKSFPQISALMLSDKICDIERKFLAARQTCQACCGRSFNFKCVSLDCPTLYCLTQVNREFQKIEHFRSVLNEMF